MSNNRPTDRFQESRVTDVFPGQGGNQGRPTELFDQSQPDYLNLLGLSPGERVNDRFLVKEPIGATSGEAEIYRCADEHTGDTVALKFYRIRMRPRQGILDQLLHLDHAELVRVIAFGTWRDRFYEVMEFCEGGTLSDYLPQDENALRRLLPEIVEGLHYLHGQGIIHRDIKPENLYFRNKGMDDLVIGDFGISSLMAEYEKVRVTNTYQNVTPDYAPPEFLFRNEVSIKFDFYSLGITLIHVVTGSSPFAGYNIRTIMGILYNGPVPPPASLSSDFQLLIKGLLQHESGNRWGYNQVRQWLAGETILADSGLPWQEDRFSGKSHPYPSCTQASNPRQLAGLLEEFDAQRDLFRGRISAWVSLFDPDLASKIDQIADNFGHKPQLGLAKLAYLLDPTLPLIINGHRLHSVEEIVHVLRSGSDSNIQTGLYSAIMGEELECWIDATQQVNNRPALIRTIESIRSRLQTQTDKDLPLLALLYTLAPQTPLVLKNGITLSRPEEIEDTVSRDPEILETLRYFLFSGRFEEWLRAAFPDRQADIAFLGDCRTTYNHDQDLAVWVLRWHFRPSLPFPFGREQAENPKDLARLIDRNPESTQKGMALMKNGWIRAWLAATSGLEGEAGQQFATMTSDTRLSEASRMENMLHFLDPSLPWPTPQPSFRTISFGSVSNESEKTKRLTIKNSGRGYLSGTITITGSGHGMTIDTNAIEGGPVTVTVRANGLGLPAGSRQQAEIIVQTAGGILSIPVIYRVTAPIGRMLARSMMWGVFGAVLLGIFRKVFGSTFPEFDTNRIPWLSLKQAGNYLPWEESGATGPSPVIAVFGFFLVFVIGISLYYAIRVRTARASIQNRQAPKQVKQID